MPQSKSVTTNNTRHLPEVVRIKRKRTQDSLEALILESSKGKKRHRTNLHVFKLQRTEDQIPLHSSSLNCVENGFLPLLQELDDSGTNFMIPRKRTQEEQLPEHFTEMLDNVLDFGSMTPPTVGSSSYTAQPLKRRKRKHTNTISNGSSSTKESNSTESTSTAELDYVYDVYYRDRSIHEYNEQTSSKIGFLKFEQDLEGLINDDDDSDTSGHVHSDDEDSNAEDFYKNDYPESDAEDEDYDRVDSDENYADDAEYTDIMKARDADEQYDDEQEQEQEQWGGDEFDDLYDRFYDNEGNGPSDFLNEKILAELETDDDDEEGEGEEGEEDKQEEFTRNTFFKSDEHDPMAIHRDRIFGKLERMINER